MSSNAPRRRLALALLLAGLSACATTRGATAPSDARWPLPPEVERIRYVRTFSTEYDLESSAWRKFARIFVPPDPSAAVGNTTGLALSVDEKVLYVACASTGKVLRVDLADGRMTLVARQEGQRPVSPFSVAVDAAGNLYVSDRAGEVFVYSAEDRFLRRFGSGKLERPTGLALDRQRQLLYVVDGSQVKSQHHRVEVFSLQGEHLRTIGTRGAAQGQFNFPVNATVAPDGRLFVVDMLNFRIQIFDPDGNPVGTFGSIGAGLPGTFDKAKAVAFDTFGNVYVVDSQQGLVQLFNARFEPLMAFGGRSLLAGYMSVPNAIVIDSKNTIFVGDFARRSVSQYQLVNTSAEDSFLPPPGGQPQQLVPPGAAPPAGERQDHPGEKPQDG